MKIKCQMCKRYMEEKDFKYINIFAFVGCNECKKKYDNP